MISEQYLRMHEKDRVVLYLSDIRLLVKLIFCHIVLTYLKSPIAYPKNLSLCYLIRAGKSENKNRVLKDKNGVNKFTYSS